MLQAVEQYVKSKNWEYKPTSEGNDKPQFNIKICPFCRDEQHPYHFYINRETGAFKCQKCRVGGWTLVALKYRLGDLKDGIRSAVGKTERSVKNCGPLCPPVDLSAVRDFHGALFENETALNWLRGRGFTIDTIKRFRLGYKQDNRGDWIIYPYFQNGHCVNLKYRLLQKPGEKKTFEWITGYPRPLYNIDSLNGSDIVTVTEGESDLITLIQAGGQGVAIPSGAENFAPEHWDVLSQFRRINLALDPDPPGRRGAAKIARRLGADRCFLVPLPERQDINDFFQQGKTLKDFEGLIEQARPMGEPTVMSAYEALQYRKQHALEEGNETGIITPWLNVNKKFPPLKAGHVMALIAGSKGGKSTFCLNWFYWLAKFKRVPVLFYSVDMPLNDMLDMLVAHVLKADREHIGHNEWVQAASYLYNVPLHFCFWSPDLSLESVTDQIELAATRYGIEAVCFDHLHVLCRGAENYFGEISKASSVFRQTAQKTKVPIVVLHQPSKLLPGQEPDLYSASGSSMIPADADVIVSLFRKPIGTHEDDEESEQSFEDKVKVNVLGSRFTAGGFTTLWLHGKCARLTESKNTEEMPYRGETNVQEQAAKEEACPA